MNDMECGTVLDRLPDWAARRLDAAGAAAVEGHLAGCDACREEGEVVRLLAEAGPRAVPAGLEARLVRAVRSAAPAARPASVVARPRWRVPTWGLAAAAGIVLAVATPVLVDRMGEPSAAPVVPAADEAEVTLALGEALPSPWLGEEGIVAGAPVLDGLSDEALEQLLEEMGG